MSSLVCFSSCFYQNLGTFSRGTLSYIFTTSILNRGFKLAWQSTTFWITYKRASKIKSVLHNFWLTIFWLLFAADFQDKPTDISCKKFWKISQSKIMQHCSYLWCPLGQICYFCHQFSCLPFKCYLKIVRSRKIIQCNVLDVSSIRHILKVIYKDDQLLTVPKKLN